MEKEEVKNLVDQVRKQDVKRGYSRGVLTAVQCLREEFSKKQVFTRTEIFEILQDMEYAQKKFVDAKP
jgi:hypothetical protein